MNEDTICWILNRIQHSDLTPFDVENLALHIDNIVNSNAQEKDQLKARILKLEEKLNIAIVALEMYGKFENLNQIQKGITTHTRHIDDIEIIKDCGYILKLKGKIAREALAKIKGIKMKNGRFETQAGF